MAKIVENSKGFKIIKLSLEEIQHIFKGFGVCDCCSDLDKVNKELYLIPVLNNRSYCEDCYNKWIKQAENHIEDRDFEQNLFEYNLHLVKKHKENMKIQDFLEKYKKQIALEFYNSENKDLILHLTFDLFCQLEIYNQETSDIEKEKIIKGMLNLEKVLNQLTKILLKSKEKDFFENLTKDLKNIELKNENNV